MTAIKKKQYIGKVVKVHRPHVPDASLNLSVNCFLNFSDTGTGMPAAPSTSTHVAFQSTRLGARMFL